MPSRRKSRNRPADTDGAELGSANFQFLAEHDPHLLRLAAGAEAYCFAEPDLSLTRTRQLAEELEDLRNRLAIERQKPAKAEDRITSLAEARAEAEALAARAYEDQLAALDLAEETEEKWRAAQDQFIRLEAERPQPTRQAITSAATAAIRASSEFLDELDEAETREIIDSRLRDAGWEANTREIRFSRGARPEKGRNKAIAEWPTSSGPVDYALFAGMQLVAVAEAKRFERDLPPVLGQARRYARDIDPKGARFPPGSPWLTFRVPFEERVDHAAARIHSEIWKDSAA